MVLLDLKSTVDELLSGLGIARADLAGAVKVDERTVERWRGGTSFPQKEARQQLEAMLKLKAQLYETFGTPEAVWVWMQTDNRYLGRLKPAEVARSGRIDRISAALEALDAGAFV
jgi:hypothetical protein